MSALKGNKKKSIVLRETLVVSTTVRIRVEKQHSPLALRQDTDAKRREKFLEGNPQGSSPSGKDRSKTAQELPQRELYESVR